MEISKKIGCDPELFLYDNIKKRIVPACGIVEGSKESPIVLKNGGMVQLDGTVLEFGTPPVDPTGLNFSKALIETLNIIRKQLFDKHGDRYELRCGAVAAYSSKDIRVGHAGLMVGCSPQYILSDGRRVIRGILHSSGTISPRKVPIGGHIHFGFVDEMVGRKVMDYSALRFIRALNRLNISSFITDVPCDATKTRNSVMNFVEFTPTIRIKPYGVEFRNLSSYWLACPDVADLFSKFHTQAVRTALGHMAVDACQVSTEIQECLQKLAEQIDAQDPKYQKTLPLAY
jgi:hypothetical protein